MDRAAIITGATRGIGNGLFRSLTDKGISVATVYHGDEASAQKFRGYAEKIGIDYHIEKIDIRDYAMLDGFVQRVVNKFGRVDYLINNIGYDDWNLLYNITLDDWKLSQDIILNAPFYLSKLVLPIMRKQGFGRIVNLGASSKDYYKGAAGIGAFGVHKAALTVLTKTLALEEIKHGITVNMVAPGSTERAGTTPEDQRIPIDKIPLGRRVTVDEIVAAIEFFLSENTTSITGQFLGVNGGLST
jgi:3-oxoacyl-[acyl-carrier protein] reductase